MRFNNYKLLVFIYVVFKIRENNSVEEINRKIINTYYKTSRRKNGDTTKEQRVKNC